VPSLGYTATRPLENSARIPFRVFPWTAITHNESPNEWDRPGAGRTGITFGKRAARSYSYCRLMEMDATAAGATGSHQSNGTYTVIRIVQILAEQVHHLEACLWVVA
jgi:hypothetical protein